ncbi:MAG: ATP-binding protein [Roseobacter sp.]
MRRKIEDQQESLQSFAMVIVHDLRAPLRGILQATEMLTEDLPDEIVAENAEMLGFVHQGAQRMDALIISLNDSSQIDSTPPAFEAVDLKVQMDRVCSNLWSVISDSGAKVICGSNLPTIQGSPPQIEQLLQNLICNAIKYNRSDAPEIRIEATHLSDRWEISIADNGIGIEPQFLKRIFEPFKRLHGNDEFEGSGLGLATCRKITARHNGRLTCDSVPGAGSTFRVHLPFSPDAGQI